MNKGWTLFGIVVAVGAVAGAAAWLQGSAEDTDLRAELEPGVVVRLAYVDWSSEVASANLVKAALQGKLGYRCELTAMEPQEMYEAVAAGEQDAMVAAWLPDTHAGYYGAIEDRVEDLGPNLEGTRTGIVVPDVATGRQTSGTGQTVEPYVTAESIGDLAEHARDLKGRIVAIGPGAGVTRSAEEAIEAYGLSGIEVDPVGEDAMTRALARAIQAEEWVAVTGWTPHWKWARWKLRYLEDPEGVFAGEGRIHTLVRKGLAGDMPEVHAFLDRFAWSPEDMNRLMAWNQGGDDTPYENALRWIRTHPEQVAHWTGEGEGGEE